MKVLALSTARKIPTRFNRKRAAALKADSLAYLVALSKAGK